MSVQIDREDIMQEIVLYHLEHPESKRCDKWITLDVLKSGKYNHSTNGIEHIYNIDNLQSNYNFDDKIFINQLLARLDRKTRAIIIRYYLFGYTQIEIARYYNLTPSLISKKIKKAIRRIRNVERYNSRNFCCNR